MLPLKNGNILCGPQPTHHQHYITSPGASAGVSLSNHSSNKSKQDPGCFHVPCRLREASTLHTIYRPPPSLLPTNTHTHSGTHRPLLSLFSSTRPTYISMSLALAGLYRQRERRDRVLVFRAQWRKKGEGASKQQREREREWEGGDSEIERRKKHKEGENIREEHRKREGKEGRGDISYCSFLSLSLPSRLRGLLLGAVLERKREWERESEREEGWTERKRAECPFTGVASD